MPLLPMQSNSPWLTTFQHIGWRQVPETSCICHRCCLAGHTPLLELHSLTSPGQGRIVAKLEGFNPQGSVKDR